MLSAFSTAWYFPWLCPKSVCFGKWENFLVFFLSLFVLFFHLHRQKQWAYTHALTMYTCVGKMKMLEKHMTNFCCMSPDVQLFLCILKSVANLALVMTDADLPWWWRLEKHFEQSPCNRQHSGRWRLLQQKVVELCQKRCSLKLCYDYGHLKQSSFPLHVFMLLFVWHLWSANSFLCRFCTCVLGFVCVCVCVCVCVYMCASIMCIYACVGLHS